MKERKWVYEYNYPLISIILWDASFIQTIECFFSVGIHSIKTG